MTTKEQNNTSVVYGSMQCVLVPIDEYETLKKENMKLKTQIYELEHHADIFRQTIARDKETIDILRKENQELREKLDILEKKYNQLEIKYDIMENKNDELLKKINKVENDNLYNKYVIAIQDINSQMELEKVVNYPYALKRLRKYRVNECHYITNEDDDEEKIGRIEILIEKLNNMPKEIKNIFDKKHPKLIETILPYIKSQNKKIDEELSEFIKSWWY
jgi:chromosome segregation ATPase